MLHCLYMWRTIKIIFGGTFGYGDSYLEFWFHHFKVFRLHAKLHDAARVVRARCGKSSSYCYLIGRGPGSCLLGHSTGLLLCLYVKLLLPSIFNSVDFLSCLSWIVLHSELADKNIFRELGVFIDCKDQGYTFRPPKKYKPTNQAFCLYKKLPQSCGGQWTFGLRWGCKHCPTAVKGRYFAKATEKTKNLCIFLYEEAENLEDHGCPKGQDLVDE